MSSNPEKRKQSSNDQSITSRPPPKKLAICLKSKASTTTIGSSSKSNETLKPSTAVKAVFDSDSDSDLIEEMTPECRMRMRNVGRDTPTSAGPNSFSKGKDGFVDGRKQAERRMQEMISKMGEKSKK